MGDNEYYYLIKKSCEGYSDEDKDIWLQDRTIYPDWDEPYDIIRKKLHMTTEEFFKFQQANESQWEHEWFRFCEAEQQVLREFTIEKTMRNKRDEIEQLISSIVDEYGVNIDLEKCIKAYIDGAITQVMFAAEQSGKELPDYEIRKLEDLLKRLIR